MQNSLSEEQSFDIDNKRPLSTSSDEISEDGLSELDDNIGNRVQSYNENGEYRFGNRRRPAGNNREYRPAQQSSHSKPYYRGRQQEGTNRYRDVHGNYNSIKSGYGNQPKTNYSQYGTTANRSRMQQQSWPQRNQINQAGGNRQNPNGSHQQYRTANQPNGHNLPMQHNYRSRQNFDRTNIVKGVGYQSAYGESSNRPYKNKINSRRLDKAELCQMGAKGRSDKKKQPRPVNLAKVLHRLDFASPKILMQALQSGIITINGQTANNLNTAIDRQKDIISAYGRELSAKQENIYVVMNKARCIAGSNEKSGATIYQNFYCKHDWFFPVGCLDKTTSGIIILTTDKRHCAPDISPIASLEKEYHCKIHKVLSTEEVVALQKFLDETLHEDIEIAAVRRNARNMVVSITVTQSSPTRLRSTLKRFGLEVLSFYRRRVGTFTTDDIPAGAWRRLAQEEVDTLNEFAEFSAQRKCGILGSKNNDIDPQQEQRSVSLKEKMQSLYRQIFKS